MAVDFSHPPAEVAPASRQRFERADRLGRRPELHTVAVDHRHQVRDALGGGAHDRLPARSLLEFAVADEHVHRPLRAVEPGGERESEPERQPVPERSGGHLHAGHRGDRVAHEAAPVHAVVGQLAGVEEAALGEGGVQADGGVALAQHEHVAVGRVRSAGVDPQHREVQDRQYIHTGQCTAEVAADVARAQVDHPVPDAVGGRREPFGLGRSQHLTAHLAFTIRSTIGMLSQIFSKPSA